MGEEPAYAKAEGSLESWKENFTPLSRRQDVVKSLGAARLAQYARSRKPLILLETLATHYRVALRFTLNIRLDLGYFNYLSIGGVRR
jgi:hypothetical protein